MIWKKKSNKHQINEVHKSTENAAKKLEAQKQKVNATASWLERRQLQNGFGQDFEYTLRPRGL